MYILTDVVYFIHCALAILNFVSSVYVLYFKMNASTYFDILDLYIEIGESQIFFFLIRNHELIFKQATRNRIFYYYYY